MVPRLLQDRNLKIPENPYFERKIDLFFNFGVWRKKHALPSRDALGQQVKDKDHKKPSEQKNYDQRNDPAGQPTKKIGELSGMGGFQYDSFPLTDCPPFLDGHQFNVLPALMSAYTHEALFSIYPWM
jgi:hypothetical protein